jgi:hypothetical protein
LLTPFERPLLSMLYAFAFGVLIADAGPKIAFSSVVNSRERDRLAIFVNRLTPRPTNPSAILLPRPTRNSIEMGSTRLKIV